VLQRVSHASVTVNGEIAGQIGRGVLILVGVAKGDTERDSAYLAEKIVNLRVFPDAAGKMNLSLLDIGGAALVVSQFTLCGDCSKGRRPGFDAAARPELAQTLYANLVSKIRAAGVQAETGVFQTTMAVSLVNDGPVTFILESNNLVRNL
jgi:D-tyrosyl-tRNA(Tyr) deacylase